MPKAFVDYYVHCGGDAVDLNRMGQILARMAADEIIEDLSLIDWLKPLGFDDNVKDAIRQKAVDFANKKFNELISRDS